MPNGQGDRDRPYDKGYGESPSGRRDGGRPNGMGDEERPNSKRDGYGERLAEHVPVPSAPLAPPPPIFDFEHHHFPALIRAKV